MFFDPEGAFGSAQGAIDAVDDFWNAMLATMAAAISYSVLPEVTTIDVSTGEATAVETGTGQTRTGYAAGDVLPPATQGLIRWTTGVFIGGRQIRGRTFIPAQLEANSSAAGAPAGTLVTAAAAAITALNGSTEVFCIYSRPQKNSAGSIIRAGQAAAVNAGSLWDQFAVLRSRRD